MSTRKSDEVQAAYLQAIASIAAPIVSKPSDIASCLAVLHSVVDSVAEELLLALKKLEK